jgi:Tol biopolymer transport system component
MEYLEGETLAERLTRGALPLNQVVSYGAAIARALDAAHRQHIVHRDLKPGNIMLTRSGVKLLDFGLAKTAEPVAARDQAKVPDPLAETFAATQAGVVMGTVPYMAPEQIEGRPADARSDIFALGAGLYEMATGRRAFTGSNPALISSAILTTDPPPIALSPKLDALVRTCLVKDPERRWQSALDVAIQLEALAAAPEHAGRRRTASRLPWAIAAGAMLLAIGALLWASGRSAAPAASSAGAVRPVAFPLPAPPRGSFNQFVEWIATAVAPDGSAIVYSASGPDGVVKLWHRPLDSPVARPLEGTEGGGSPFWSPDGRALAFFADGKLKRIDVAAGRAPVTICTVREAIGQMGTWGADGKILFASVQGEALLAVDASGGTPVEVRRPDLKRGEVRFTWPTFLPDGRSYLFLSAFPDDSGVVMISDANGNARKLLDVKSNVQYVEPGYLLFASDGSLVARRFDPAAGTISGDLIPVGDRVTYFKATGLAQFSASRTGVVASQPNEDISRIAVFDRTGREKAALQPAQAYYQTLNLSPDGRRLLFDKTDPRAQTLDIWMLDLQRGVEQRVTDDPRTDTFPLWGPAGTIIHAVASGSAPRLFKRDLATGKDHELSPHGVGLQTPTSVSPDGRFVLYSQRTDRGTFDLMVRRLEDNQTLPFRQTAANESDGQFSPHGTLVAYVSNESGRPEIMVAPFPTGAGVTASSGGAFSPRWSADGRELFYIGSDGMLRSAPVQRTPSLDVGRPTLHFSTRTSDGFWRAYVVADQGFYAIVHTQVGAQLPMSVLVNWPAMISR